MKKLTQQETKLSASLLAGTTALLILVITAPAAFAVSPHFLSASSGINSSHQLTCTFKEAGLGNLGTTNIQETCSGDVTATYVCVNKGGNHPQAANKETVTGTVTGSDTFPIRNGQTSGTITVKSSPPGPGDFSCPGGQKLELSSVTYTNVKICDAFNNCVNLADQKFTDPNVPT